MENQIAPKLPGSIQLLKDSFLVYKLRFKTIIGMSFIFYLQILFIAALVIIAGAVGIALAFASKFSLPVIILLVILAVIFMLLFVFIQNWTIFALITSIVGYREGIGIKESFKRSFKKTIPYMWMSAIGNMIAGVGLLFFIIPGIILFTWFFNATFILAAEGVGGFNALLKSKEYVKGRFFSVLLNIVVLVIILILFQAGISFLPKLISFLHIPYLDIIIPAAISIAFAPLGFIYSFLIYDNLKAIKGDFVFQPSKKTKILLLLIIFIPLIITIVVLYYLFTTVFPMYRMLGSMEKSPRISITPTQNQTLTPAPSNARPKIETFTGPDGTWSLQYDPNRTSPPAPNSTGSFIFTSTEHRDNCPRDLTAYIINNPTNILLNDYLASNPAYFGVKQEEAVINGMTAIKTITTTSPLRVLYSINDYQRFIILSYPRIFVGGGLPDPCIESEKYVESLIFSFRIINGVIN